MKNQLYQRLVCLNKQPLIIFSITSIAFLLILVRLFFLQIINYQDYKAMSDQNRIRLIASQPVRGNILDRNGNVLANSRLNYSLIIKPQSFDENTLDQKLLSLSLLLNISQEEMTSRYNNGLETNEYSIQLVDDLSAEQLIKFQENQNEFLGIEIQKNVIRNYPYKSLAAHALGYISPITEAEYEFLSNDGYRLNDLIGRTGIEDAYEHLLRGEWGGEMIEVDAVGNFQRSLGVKPSQKGEDIQLTIDLDIQLVAEEVLKDKKGGAIIVMDPRDGAILAIASKPTFDLNFFSRDFKPEEEYNYLLFSSINPMLNRALTKYDPGSVWKIVTALAGLESGEFPQNILLETSPYIVYGSSRFREHNDLGFGLIGYEDALRVSSNTFFYQVGYGVGVDKIYEISQILGFSQLSGIEINQYEDPGIIANSDWAESGRGWGQPGETPWRPEDIASMSIGQFVVQVTPIQIARAYAAIANGGYLVTPHLSKLNPNYVSPNDLVKIDIEPDHIQIIKNGLEKVVQSGTGVSINYGLTNFPTVSGKTGTAEDANGGADHAWFVCYSPSENSEILIVAFAENTPGGGSVHALPMAKKILEVWNTKYN